MSGSKMEARMIRYETGKTLTLEFTSGSVRGSKLTYSVESLDGKTRLTADLEMRLSGVWKLMCPILTRRRIKDRELSVANVKRSWKRRLRLTFSYAPKSSNPYGNEAPVDDLGQGQGQGFRRIVARPAISVRSSAALRIRSSMVRGLIPSAIVNSPTKTPRTPTDWATVAARRLQGGGVQVSSSPATRTAAITNSTVPAARWL